MDENRDRLIDMLLQEELGREQPPDLTDRILQRAFATPSRPGSRALGFRTLLVAASLLLAVGLAAWWLWPSYPEPRASGQFEIVGVATDVRRGVTLRTTKQAAAVDLGGYAHADIKPASVVRIDGEKYAESLFLEAGELNSTVERGRGSFAVRTQVGTVSVVGTQFTVRVVEEKGDGDMIKKRMVVHVLSGMVLVVGVWGETQLSAGAEKTFAADEPKKAEAKSGSVVGVVSAKGENWIEVKADGEEKARRYVPNWVGGAPAQGGGPDKAMIKVIRETPMGARVKLDWKFEERARVVKIEILKKDGDKK